MQEGTLTYPDGKTYTGEFLNDVPKVATPAITASPVVVKQLASGVNWKLTQLAVPGGNTSDLTNII